MQADRHRNSDGLRRSNGNADTGRPSNGDASTRELLLPTRMRADTHTPERADKTAPWRTRRSGSHSQNDRTRDNDGGSRMLSRSVLKPTATQPTESAASSSSLTTSVHRLLVSKWRATQFLDERSTALAVYAKGHL